MIIFDYQHYFQVMRAFHHRFTGAERSTPDARTFLQTCLTKINAKSSIIVQKRIAENGSRTQE